MKLSVALFFAGIFGALAAVFILLSFGTDYWLLASENCQHNSSGSVELGDVAVEVGVGSITSVYCALAVNGEPRLDVFNMTENLRRGENGVVPYFNIFKKIMFNHILNPVVLGMKNKVSPSVLGPAVSGNKGHLSGWTGGWGGIPAGALHVIRHCFNVLRASVCPCASAKLCSSHRGITSPCTPVIEIQIPAVPLVWICIKYHRREHT